jgi:hypothetical protein
MVSSLLIVENATFSMTDACTQALLVAALQGLGSALALEGEYSGAQPVLSLCLRLEPRCKECLLTLAAVKTELGDEGRCSKGILALQQDMYICMIQTLRTGTKDSLLASHGVNNLPHRPTVTFPFFHPSKTAL